MKKYTLSEQLKDLQMNVKDAKKALRQSLAELKLVNEFIALDTKNLAEAEYELKELKRINNI